MLDSNDMRIASQDRINRNFAKICEQTNFMPLQFIANFKKQVKELEPDYPWDDENDTAFTYLWAIVEGYKGTRKACDDWAHAFETVKVIGPLHPDNTYFQCYRNNNWGEGNTKMEALANLYEKEGTAPYGR